MLFPCIIIGCLFSGCGHTRQYNGMSKNEILEKVPLSRHGYLLGYIDPLTGFEYRCIAFRSKDMIKKSAMSSKKWYVDFVGEIGWLTPQTAQAVIFDCNDIVIEQYTVYNYDGP